jgi:hypothetical protein
MGGAAKDKGAMNIQPPTGDGVTPGVPLLPGPTG